MLGRRLLYTMLCGCCLCLAAGCACGPRCGGMTRIPVDVDGCCAPDCCPYEGSPFGDPPRRWFLYWH